MKSTRIMWNSYIFGPYHGILGQVKRFKDEFMNEIRWQNVPNGRNE